MANITTVNSFIGQNNIPDKLTVSENLTWFINKYEPKLLKELMGSDLYAAYLAMPSDARFTALLPYLTPALVDYIYWYYLEDQGVQLTSLGASQGKKKNAISVSPYGKMVRAWNEMAKANRDLHKYIKDNASTYPEYTIAFPEWFFFWGWGYAEWGPCFDECDVPEIYRYKNRLGI